MQFIPHHPHGRQPRPATVQDLAVLLGIPPVGRGRTPPPWRGGWTRAFSLCGASVGPEPLPGGRSGRAKRAALLGSGPRRMAGLAWASGVIGSSFSLSEPSKCSAKPSETLVDRCGGKPPLLTRSTARVGHPSASAISCQPLRNAVPRWIGESQRPALPTAKPPVTGPQPYRLLRGPAHSAGGLNSGGVARRHGCPSSRRSRGPTRVDSGPPAKPPKCMGTRLSCYFLPSPSAWVSRYFITRATSVLLPTTSGVRSCSERGTFSMMRPVPSVAAPPACSARKAMGFAS